MHTTEFRVESAQSQGYDWGRRDGGSKSKPVRHIHFDSVADLDQNCLRAPMKGRRNEELRASYVAGSDSWKREQGETWYGVRTINEALQCFERGYVRGAEMVDKLYDTVAPSLPRAVDFRRKLTRSDQGDSLDIHAVNRGALDKAWTVAKRSPMLGTGIIRITVDIAANAGTHAQSMQWRGVAALALSRALTKAGYSVEIVAGCVTRGVQTARPDLMHLVTCVVKPRHAAVDLATLASAVALPAFFRVPCFAALVRIADDMGGQADDGLGCCMKLESVLPVPEKVMQVVAQEWINSEESALKWVRDQIALIQMSTVSRERGAR